MATETVFEIKVRMDDERDDSGVPSEIIWMLESLLRFSRHPILKAKYKMLDGLYPDD